MNLLQIVIRGPMPQAIMDEHSDGFLIDVRLERDEGINQSSYFCPTNDMNEALKSASGLITTGNFLSNSKYGKSTHLEPITQG